MNAPPPSAPAPATPAPTSAAPAAKPTPAPAPKAAAESTELKRPNAPSKAAPQVPAPTEATPEAKAAEAKRKYKLKVDGQEQELELEDAEVSVRLQKSMAAEKRMQEAAEVRKQFQQLKELAKSDPAALMRELAGVDPMEWAKQQVEQQWKLEVMPEHERKVYELEQQLKSYQTQEQRRQQVAEQQRAQQAQSAMEQQLEKDFQRAFEVSGLEWTPDNLELFGKIVLDAHDFGLELTPEQLAAEAKTQLHSREKKYEDAARGKFSALKGPELLDYLGEATVREVLRAQLVQAPSLPALAVRPEGGSPAGRARKAPV
jgi:hypothetical protein